MKTTSDPQRDQIIRCLDLAAYHYLGDCDWFISEYDGEDLFFGYAIIGNPAFAEWGYMSFKELKQIRVPPGIEVDCELFAPPLKASEIEEIKTH